MLYIIRSLSALYNSASYHFLYLIATEDDLINLNQPEVYQECSAKSNRSTTPVFGHTMTKSS